MPVRSWIVLGLGLVIALATAMSLKSRMSAHEAAPAAVTQVLIATTDIAAGSFVRSDAQLALTDWPKNNITESMLTSDTTKPSDFNGAVARRALAKGEAITKNVLVKSSEGGFMSAVLEGGKRAVSIAVDSTTGNAGFIFPGDHVDLILTHLVNKQNSQLRASETFIENARVLAVDQMIDNPENKAMLAKTVTLEVTPKQAEEINLAKDLGKISLSLRSLANKKRDVAIPPVKATPETLDDILKENIEEEAAAAMMPEENVTRDTEVSKIISPQDAAGNHVLLIRGNERTDLQFGPDPGAARAQ